LFRLCFNVDYDALSPDLVGGYTAAMQNFEHRREFLFPSLKKLVKIQILRHRAPLAPTLYS
jgi:hypothetical protein